MVNVVEVAGLRGKAGVTESSPVANKKSTGKRKERKGRLGACLRERVGRVRVDDGGAK